MRETLLRAAVLSLLLATAAEGAEPPATDGVALDPDTLWPAALSFRQRLDIKYEAERNLNLDRDDKEDEATLEPELTLSFDYEPNDRFRAYASLELVRKYGFHWPDAETDPTRLQLAEAYLMFDEIDVPGSGELTVQLGRQRFDDERTWLYDEQLDGLRLHYEYDDFALELSATRERNKNLLRGSDRAVFDNYLAYGRYEFDDALLAAYVLRRTERSEGGEKPLFIGVQSHGEPVDDLHYWLELARVRGRDGSRDIRGVGFDVGATYEFDLPSRPSLTLGYAFGSGDGDPDDGIDRAFRQTGLQDNEHELDGLADFRYYGVVLEPELSNLEILTVGLGVKPGERLSLHLLYHAYRQHRAGPTLRDTNLDTDPNGRDRDLGSAIDLVMGVELDRHFSVDIELGYFMPGKAFDDDDNAFLAELDFKYEF